MIAVFAAVSQSILRLRGRNLQFGIAKALVRSEIELDGDPRFEAVLILNSPNISLNVRENPLSYVYRIIGPSVSSVAPDQLLDALYRRLHLDADKLARIEKEYLRLSGPLHDRYVLAMRILTFVWATIIAFVFQMSTLNVLQELFYDPTSPVELAEGMEEADSIIDPARDATAQVHSPTLALWPYGNRFYMENGGLEINNVFGVLMTGVLLTIGARLWHKVPNFILHSRRRE